MRTYLSGISGREVYSLPLILFDILWLLLCCSDKIPTLAHSSKHADWAEDFAKNYAITADNALDIVKAETGKVFAKVLEHAGVYARTPQGEERLPFLPPMCEVKRIIPRRSNNFLKRMTVWRQCLTV